MNQENEQKTGEKYQDVEIMTEEDSRRLSGTRGDGRRLKKTRNDYRELRGLKTTAMQSIAKACLELTRNKEDQRGLSKIR